MMTDVDATSWMVIHVTRIYATLRPNYWRIFALLYKKKNMHLQTWLEEQKKRPNENK